MRHKKLRLIAVFCLGIGLAGLQAQTMYVKESNGTQTAYALSNIRKMSFSSGSLTVTKKDNSSGVYALSDLRFLNFTDTSTGLEKPAKNEMLSVYPNPVSNVLNIHLPGQKGTLSIFNFEGKTVLSQQVNAEG